MVSKKLCCKSGRCNGLETEEMRLQMTGKCSGDVAMGLRQTMASG